MNAAEVKSSRASLVVSVVVATHSRCHSLRRCLAALQCQRVPPLEIIVVDDASTDATADMVRTEFPGVRLVSLDRNLGPAGARNRGISLARGEIVAFTDDDCVPGPDWLDVLLQGFMHFPGVVGVGGYQEASEALIKSNAIAAAERAIRLRKWGDMAKQSRLGGMDVPGLGTNNVAFRRDALLEVEGFDETFPGAAGEDTDLKLRLLKAAEQRSTASLTGPFLYLPLKVCHEREYSWRAQWRMGLRRGIGAYHFEQKYGDAPGLLRVGLRAIKRSLKFAVDLWRLPARVALAIYVLRIADCFGQLQMVGHNWQQHILTRGAPAERDGVTQ